MDEPCLPAPSPIDLARRLSALTGLAALALASAGWVFRPDAFWRAYLLAWLLCATVTLGCALTLLVDRVLRHDRSLQATLRAGWRTTPLVVVLTTPLVLHGVESARWLLAAATAQPIAATMRLTVVGPALAALTLTLTVLAALAQREPAVFTPTAARFSHLSLSVLLALDAALTFALSGRAYAAPFAVAAIEIGVAAYTAFRSRARPMAVVGIVAFLTYAASLRCLLPEPALLSDDPMWVSAALDLLLIGALGGLWLALFLWRLDRNPPPPFQPTDEGAPGVQAREGARAEKPARP